MPIFESELLLKCPPAQVFEFLARPANLLLVSPPEFHLKLLEAPERLALGARITIQGSKFGIPQKIISEVTAFEDGVAFTDEQVSGPFGKFKHTHSVAPDPIGCKMTDRIEYESPGGLIGLMLTNDRIRRDLQTLADFRAEKFKLLLEQ